MEARLDQLVQLAREVGRPERDLVVLAEGNVSALLDDGTFLVKASGARMARLRGEEIVRLQLEPLLEAMQDGAPRDVGALLREAHADPSPGAGPASIETFVHVVCLGLGGARFVVHTHPTPLVGMLCSPAAEELLTAGPLFPDEVVVCGAAPLYVGYHEPGLALARAVAPRLRAHAELHGEPPRTIYLANHGLFATGGTPAEALAVTEMAVKAARVRLAAVAAGGLRALAPESVAELAARPDELERRGRLS
ncbi:MAG: class II aldolase/adducin family protein [Gaiellaceae bacterium]